MSYGLWIAVDILTTVSVYCIATNSRVNGKWRTGKNFQNNDGGLILQLHNLEHM